MTVAKVLGAEKRNSATIPHLSLYWSIKIQALFTGYYSILIQVVSLPLEVVLIRAC